MLECKLLNGLNLIHEGVRPWSNPFGAGQFGSYFFMITGFHGTHVSIGVIFLFIFARKVFRGDFDTGKEVFYNNEIRLCCYRNIRTLLALC